MLIMFLVRVLRTVFSRERDRDNVQGSRSYSQYTQYVVPYRILAELQERAPAPRTRSS